VVVVFIKQVDIEVSDLGSATSFFAEVLEVPVRREHGRTDLTIGGSTLILAGGERSAGVHHLAFDIPPAGFEAHRAWLEAKLPLLASADGTTEFEGPPGWNSRSIYFSGPDQMVLELIARRERPRPSTRVPELISISEVGIAVADPLDTAQAVQAETGTGVLGIASPEFVPVGDHDGLLILVRDGRAWLPRFDVAARVLPLRISVATDAGNGKRAFDSLIRLNSLAEAVAF
jgi:catechol 2,3-dioxygenase-like lactoylglutathione lyase family enzyme